MTGGAQVGVWAVAAVALGGAVGAVLRHLLASAPWGAVRGVLAANVVGAAVLGLLVALLDDPVLLLLLGTGLCGALTTWSTLALQAVELGRPSRARGAAYLVLTVLVGCAGAGLALTLTG